MSHASSRRTAARAAVLLVGLVGLPLTVLATAAADPSAAQWETLRQCESSGRYSVVARQRYYGAYQFDLPTWRSVGGVGLPSDATPEEQDYRALYLYRMRGWQPWECATIKNLIPDADARSKRVPTRAESAYMGTGKKPAPAAPPWPGRVYRFGECGASLRTWQLQMNNRGLDFRGTGCYGTKTEQAVRNLQRARGINPSGLLGPRTWQAAWTAGPVRP